jgi:inorganic pyrophosphatase
MELDMIVEVPKGSRNKYEFDPMAGRSGSTGCSSPPPAIPPTTAISPRPSPRTATRSTPWSSLDEPTFPGCEIHVRSVGVFWMRDEEGPDVKILTVPAADPRFADIKDLADIPDYQLGEIWHFFEVYKDLEPGKDTDIRGWQDRTAAALAPTACTCRHLWARNSSTFNREAASRRAQAKSSRVMVLSHRITVRRPPERCQRPNC